ncbi:hypothetical protein [Marinicella gelatinilytica]|uniref:hypothetical protein n=1 Tax=Marinicella gelatinilytica TaxID=2996017 RepID=UPI002260BE7E|nr:hypothetical protein [Marinicella gelatinilytica]MCX7546188.1 hypothetical protein [Marinicella gelatinilytica]
MKVKKMSDVLAYKTLLLKADCRLELRYEAQQKAGIMLGCAGLAQPTSENQQEIENYESNV